MTSSNPERNDKTTEKSGDAKEALATAVLAGMGIGVKVALALRKRNRQPRASVIPAAQGFNYVTMPLQEMQQFVEGGGLSSGPVARGSAAGPAQAPVRRPEPFSPVRPPQVPRYEHKWVPKPPSNVPDTPINRPAPGSLG